MSRQEVKLFPWPKDVHSRQIMKTTVKMCFAKVANDRRFHQYTRMIIVLCQYFRFFVVAQAEEQRLKLWTLGTIKGSANTVIVR
jgi:hypothetical protein